MIIEIQLPDDWPPGLGFTIARLLRKTLAEGFPVVAAVRPDVTDEELSEAFARVREAITQAGLAALYRTHRQVGDIPHDDRLSVSGAAQARRDPG